MALKFNMLSVFATLSLFVASVSAQVQPPHFQQVVMAHAIVGPLVFVILLPAGGLVMRVCDFKGVVWAHAAIQIMAYAMFIFVFGSGVWFNVIYGSWRDPHIIVGIILFFLMTVQPFLGTIHHQLFKSKGRRTFLSILHVYIGRTIIPIGILNGGLGLILGGDATHMQVEAYAITGGLVWFFYSLAVAYTESKNVKEQQWMLETDDAATKMEMGIEARKIGVYEKTP